MCEMVGLITSKSPLESQTSVFRYGHMIVNTLICQEVGTLKKKVITNTVSPVFLISMAMLLKYAFQRVNHDLCAIYYV